MSTFIPPGLGWLPDVPDPRDYTLDHPEIQPLLPGLKKPGARLPKECAVDEDQFLSPIRNQAPLNSSCAFAVLDLVEFLERKQHGRSLQASRLFLFQMALRLAGEASWKQPRYSSGTSLRTTLKALKRFGAPPEKFWPYDAEHFERKPKDPFLYGFTREFEGLHYFRLDPPGCTPEETLRNIKRLLNVGIPCVCGFSVPRSLASDEPYISPPNGRNETHGGQAILILCYDDKFSFVKETARPQRTLSTGAFYVRSYWGSEWGYQGHGWFPYQFSIGGFARDCWSVGKPDGES